MVVEKFYSGLPAQLNQPASLFQYLQSAAAAASPLFNPKTEEIQPAAGAASAPEHSY